MMKRMRISCLAIVLGFVLIGMMVGLIGLASLLPSTRYTPEQQSWLADNYQRQMMQEAPVFNTYGYVSGQEDLLDKGTAVVMGPPIATGARESRVKVDMNVTYKEREGVAVTAYDLRFEANYLVANPNPEQAVNLEMDFPFPRNAAVLSEATFEVEGSEPLSVTYTMQSIHWIARLEPGQEHRIAVRYRAEGVGSFGYTVPSSQRIRDFDLQVNIQGAQDIEIPDSALAPTNRQTSNEGTVLSWQYRDVITNHSIQVELPAKASLAFAQRIEQLGSFFMQLALLAPVLTGLFLLFLWIAMRLENLSIALEHNALMGIGFFLFYPLFIFSASFLGVSWAFVIALAIAGALVIGYGMWIAGRQLAVIYLVPLLIVFYGLLTRGLTSSRYLGITLVLSGVLLVALFMWRVSRSRPALAPAAAAVNPVNTELSATPVEPAARTASPDLPAPFETSQVEAPPARRAERFCVHCGQSIEADFKFCPHCGEDAQTTRRCPECGLEYVPGENAPVFCPACGKRQQKA